MWGDAGIERRPRKDQRAAITSPPHTPTHPHAHTRPSRLQTNALMATHVESALDKLADFKVVVDTDDFDYLLRPVVQSGGTYNTTVVNPQLASNTSRFTDDVIMVSTAMRYKQHSAFIARTYFVDPTPSQLRVYDAVLEAQAALIDKLRPGAVISQIFGAVSQLVRCAARTCTRAHARVRFRSMGTRWALHSFVRPSCRCCSLCRWTASRRTLSSASPSAQGSVSGAPLARCSATYITWQRHPSCIAQCTLLAT